MDAFHLRGVKQGLTGINGIQSQNFSQGVQALIQGAGGAVDPTYAAVMQWAPSLSFSTLDVGAALTAWDIDGTDAADLELAFQDVASGGTRGTSFVTAKAYGGVIVPMSVSADNMSPATIEIGATLIGNAANAPLSVATTSQTMDQEATVAYVAGPADIDSVDIDVQSLSIDFGVEVRTLTASGIQWPITAYIVSRQPTITISTLDLGILDDLVDATDAGVAITSASFYLRKIDEGGTRVANATAEHIKFTVTDGVAYTTTGSGDHGGEATLEVMVQPVFDGTNAIIQVATASAIT